MTSPTPSSLEEAFSILLNEITAGRDVKLRIFVLGKPHALNPVIQEELFLIGREAVMNALRHSNPTNIEVEVQYLRCLLHLFIRDNGSGVNPDAAREARDSRCGLCGMRERAERIGGQFGLWSRRGAGTEVHVTVPSS